eukprot:CAMPEP_0174719822 /NCGR_PEP_ID=MMETSP1094-20130205/32064_1 /TAXON_ID=156173 /ORGANISM="Chrysochromulina brevifilum, Strain UTEX LB 985" /LENGTH=171 /DNA_ID=CAMNT_0015920199 /DNA_START=15 /DNA_END=530 /DNA_ORIENTATION=-
MKRAAMLLASCWALTASAMALHAPILRYSQFRQLRHLSPMLTADDATAKAPLDDMRLATLASLDAAGRAAVDEALDLRNRERILSGLPTYPDVEAMVEAYKEFEGRDKGMTVEECEDSVVRYLQRQSLMSEGAADIKDPQTLFSLLLLAALVISVGGKLLLPPDVIAGFSS